jgi:r-opsin
VTCSYDYLTEDWNHKTYIIYAFVLNYMLPMIIVIFFYSQIVKAVISHESALKAQAKKMNVESLRSNAVRNF